MIRWGRTSMLWFNEINTGEKEREKQREKNILYVFDINWIGLFHLCARNYLHWLTRRQCDVMVAHSWTNREYVGNQCN